MTNKDKDDTRESLIYQEQKQYSKCGGALLLTIKVLVLDISQFKASGMMYLPSH